MNLSPSLQARRTVEFSSICSDTAVENWVKRYQQHGQTRSNRCNPAAKCFLFLFFCLYAAPFCRPVCLRLSAAVFWSESQLAAPHQSSGPLRCSATPAFISWDRHRSISVWEEDAKCHSWIFHYTVLAALVYCFSTNIDRVSFFLYSSMSAWQIFSHPSCFNNWLGDNMPLNWKNSSTSTVPRHG